MLYSGHGAVSAVPMGREAVSVGVLLMIHRCTTTQLPTGAAIIVLSDKETNSVTIASSVEASLSSVWVCAEVDVTMCVPRALDPGLQGREGQLGTLVQEQEKCNRM